MTTIITKNSSTTSAVPAAGDLVAGELAVNTADKKLFTKNGSTIVKLVGSLGNQEANAVAITGGTITGMGTPSGSSDVAPKSYVDGLISTGASNASAAAASATAAATSATNAASSASAASTSASNASTSASAAATAQTAAEAARDATLTAYDNFDDRYLGTKTSDPTVDNDGNALLAGSLYFNSTSQVMKLYTGSAWVAAYVSGAGYAAVASSNTFSANQIVEVTDNTNAALRVTQLGTGNAILVEDSANPDSTPFAVNANGQVIAGASSAVTGEIVQVFGTSDYFKFSNDANSSSARFFKGRGTTNAFTTIVNNGDAFGTFDFYGSDGVNPILGARIQATVDGTPGTNDMPGRLVFSTTADGASAPTERMRISNSGSVGIGTTSITDRNLGIGKNITGATSAYGVVNNGQIQSDVTTVAQYYRTTASTAASAFTLTTLDHFSANQGTIGAGSAVTSQVGFNVGPLTGATNNYGFYGAVASGTGRWNLYMAGTAANYFGGQIQLNQDYIEKPYSANSSTAITLDLTNGTVQIITLTGNATITMPTATSGKSFIMYLKQDGTGSRTVTWSTVKWAGGTAPTITSTASKMDILSFFADGTNWYGVVVGQNYTP